MSFELKEYSELIEHILLKELERDEQINMFRYDIVKLLKYFMNIKFDCDYLTLYKLINDGGTPLERDLYNQIWRSCLREEYIFSKINKGTKYTGFTILSYDNVEKEYSFAKTQNFIRECKDLIGYQLYCVKCLKDKELSVLPLRIIFCEDNDEVKDTIYCHLEDVCKCKPYEWERLYNILLI